MSCPGTQYWNGKQCQNWLTCGPVPAVNGSCGGYLKDPTNQWCIYAPTINVWCPDGSTPSNAWCKTTNTPPNIDSVCKPVPTSYSLSSITNVDNIKISSFASNVIVTANVAPLSNVMYNVNLPPIVTDPSFPQEITDALEGCTGSCKYVAADFYSNTATTYTSLPYVINTAFTTPENSAIFVSNTASEPVTFSSPLGYELSQGFDESQVVFTSWSQSEANCAARCDAYTGCTAFNYSATSQLCQLITATEPTTSGTSQFYGFKKKNFMFGYTFANNQYPAGSNLNAEGSFCDTMTACNADIQKLVNDNVSGFSTGDILSCAYCPVRTFAVNPIGAKFVKNEIGTFEVINTSIGDSLLYKNNSGNPSKPIEDGIYYMHQWLHQKFVDKEVLVIDSQLIIIYDQIVGSPVSAVAVASYLPENQNVINIQPVSYVDNGYVLRTGSGIITYGIVGDVVFGEQTQTSGYGSTAATLTYNTSGQNSQAMQNNATRLIYSTVFSCSAGIVDQNSCNHSGSFTGGSSGGYSDFTTTLPSGCKCVDGGVTFGTTGTSDFNGGIFIFTRLPKTQLEYLKQVVTSTSYIHTESDEYFHVFFGAPNLTAPLTIRIQFTIPTGALGTVGVFGAVSSILLDSTAGLAIGDKIFIDGIIGPCKITSLAAQQLSITFDTVVNTNLAGTIVQAGARISCPLLKRKFNTGDDNLMFQWYKEINPAWSELPIANNSLKNTFADIFYTDPEPMPDPYENLGILRTKFVPPPASAGTWASTEPPRQGCDNGCPGNYLLYNCYNRDKYSCDTHNNGMAMRGPVCADTWNICEPNDATLLSTFTYTIPGLTPIDIMRRPGEQPGYDGLSKTGGNLTDTNSTHWSTIYSITGNIDGFLAVPIPSYFYLFPDFTIDRIRRGKYISGSVEATALGPSGCQAGFGLERINSLEFCEACIAGTWSPGGLNTCTACPSGTYCPHGSDRNDRICQPGFYCYTPASEIACPLGFYCPQGVTSPISCDTSNTIPGAVTTPLTAAVAATTTTQTSIDLNISPSFTFEDGAVAGLNGILGPLQYVTSRVAGTPTFTIVNPQFYSTINTGTNLVVQTRAHYCPPQSSAPTKCSPGFYCPTSSQQLNCTSGHYCKNANDATYGVFQPKDCPDGTYYSPPNVVRLLTTGQVNTDGSNCYTCPGNSNSDKSGCDCGTGTGLIWDISTASCIKNCPKGSYADVLSATGCTVCAPGTYTPESGFPECIRCPNNFNSTAVDDTGNVPPSGTGATSCLCTMTRIDGLVLPQGTQMGFSNTWNRCYIKNCPSGYTNFWSNCVPNSINAVPASWPGCGLFSTNRLYELPALPYTCRRCPWGEQPDTAGICHVNPLCQQAGSDNVTYSSGPANTGGMGSDIRLKKNIKATGRFIGRLREYTWDWNSEAQRIGWSGHRTRGVLAQEALFMYPDMVTLHTNGYFMVNYNFC
jgi:hypothetical protein